MLCCKTTRICSLCDVARQRKCVLCPNDFDDAYSYFQYVYTWKREDRSGIVPCTDLGTHNEHLPDWHPSKAIVSERQCCIFLRLFPEHAADQGLIG